LKGYAYPGKKNFYGLEKSREDRAQIPLVSDRCAWQGGGYVPLVLVGSGPKIEVGFFAYLAFLPGGSEM
jgi:hypothetical protein